MVSIASDVTGAARHVTAGGPDQAGRSAVTAQHLRPVRSWPLLVLAAPAAVAVWSGWVGIGQMTGFGEIHPLPGIWDSLHLDTAVTLPIGVEAYAAFALRVWLTNSPVGGDRTRRFARGSATGRSRSTRPQLPAEARRTGSATARRHDNKDGRPRTPGPCRSTGNVPAISPAVLPVRGRWSRATARQAILAAGFGSHGRRFRRRSCGMHISEFTVWLWSRTNKRHRPFPADTVAACTSFA
jgi:hypothetical protein